MDNNPTVNVNTSATADHDLLIRLDTKFDIFGGKLDDLSINLSGRVEKLEIASTQNIEEHKNFVPVKYLYIAIGASWVIQFVIGYYLIAHFGNIPL